MLGILAGPAAADTAGPNNPSSASGTNWVNPTGIFAVDSASASYNNTTQDYLFATGFGFSVSTHAVVQGISVTRKGSSLGNTAARRQYQMALTKNGTALVGTAKTAQALPQTTDDTVVLGSTSDVWGTTWTGAEVSSPSFGVMLRDNDTTAFQISFDNVNVTITYTPPEPQSVSISSTSMATIKALWTNATTPEQGFVVEASTDVFPNNYTGNKSSATASTSATTLTVSALSANTTYFLRVGSRWTDGTTTYSSVVSTSTLAPLASNAQIYRVFFTSATVNWQALPVSPSSATSEGYSLQASTAADFSGALISSITASVSVSTLTLSGLAPSTTYYFRVGSLNWGGVANYLNLGSTKTVSTTWFNQIVESAGDIGNYVSMAIDSAGNPHIAYWDHTTPVLKYAKWTGTSWSTQTVDSIDPDYICLTLDSNDRPNISYHDAVSFKLKFANWTGSSWSTQTYDSSINLGLGSFVAMDGAGNPHILYRDENPTNVFKMKYASWTGTKWTTQTVITDGNVGETETLVIDPLGNPHFTYRDLGSLRPVYVEWNGVAWSSAAVDTVTGDVGYDPHLCLDGYGIPRISYRTNTGLKLMYAKWNGSSWDLDTVEGGGNAGSYPDMVLDGNGNPHISYDRDDAGTLHYAYWTGTVWSTQTVYTPTGGLGNFTAIGLDSTGGARIAVQDFANLNLILTSGTLTGFPPTMGGGNTKSRYQAPSNFTASNVYSTSVTWTWTDNSVNEFGFRLYGSAVSTGPYSLIADSTTLPANTVSYTETGLTSGTTYYRYLVAVNAGGHIFSNSASAQTQIAPPSLGSVTSASTVSLTAVWNLAAGATGYTLAASTFSTNPPTVIWTSSTTVGNAVTTATLSGLYPNTTYYLFVRSNYSGGSTAYTAYAATSTLANFPSNIQFGSVNYTSMTVTWTAMPASPSSSTCEGFFLQASTASDFTGLLYSSQTTVSSLSGLTVSGLYEGATYYCRLGSLNWSGAVNYAVSVSTKLFTRWSFTAVGVSTFGYNMSMALDANNYPAFSYYDGAGGNLMYAKWNGTSWSTQTIESNGDVGKYSSLALDTSGYPAITYYDLTNGDLKYAKWNGASWSTQTIDSSGDVGQWPSIALDANGYPAISYFDNTNLDLKYARWNGVVWTTQTIESNGDVGRFTSIAFNPSGLPSISYCEFSNLALKYAAWNGTSWSTQTVDSQVIEPHTLVFDANGNPSISYVNSSHDPKYAKWDGASWNKQVIETFGAFVTAANSLALDGNGNPSMSYYAPTLDLKYAQWNGTSWSTTTFDYVGNVGNGSSIAIDGSGVVHIVYFDFTNLTLKYASATLSGITPAIGGGNGRGRPQAPTNFAATSGSSTQINWTWTDNASNELGYRLYGSTVSTGTYTLIADSTTLGAGSNSYSETGLTANTAYYRYVVAVNAGNYAFSNVVSTTTPGPTWANTTVDANGTTGEFASMALDSSGNPHIAYHDKTIPALRYAKWTGTGWSTQTVDATSADVGDFASIALDANDYPHISYRDGANGKLKYAKWTGTAWSTQTVDSSVVNLSSGTSIALDPAGYPHILYRDNNGGLLKHARWTGTVWSTQTLINGNTGTSYSLALDAAGNDHVVYRDTTGNVLKYIKWTGSVWTSSVTADSFAGGGVNPSLAVDANGREYVFHQSATGSMGYATNKTGSWVSSPVPPTGSVGSWLDVALDGAANPNICYRNDTNASDVITYARWTGAAWSTQTVVNSYVAIGSGTSISIDGTGRILIAYQDGDNFDLEVASITTTGATGSIGGGKAKGRCQAPTNFTAANVYTTSITWTWTDNASNESGYRLYGSTVSTGTFTLIVDSTTLGANSNSYTETSLTAGTTYYRYVVAVNNGGYAYSNTANNLPVSPTPITIVSATTGTLTANWGLISSATGYSLAASTMSTNPPTVISGSTTTVGNAVTTGTVSGLYPNTTYYLFVQANNSGSSTVYSAYPATYTLANLPTSIQATAVYVASVTVSWSMPLSPSSSTCEGFLLQASTVSDFTGLIFSSQTNSAAVTSLTVSTLTVNTTFYYRVASLNQTGALNFSAASSTCTFSPSWSTRRLDSWGLYSTLALDSGGNPGLGYEDNTNSLLKYAKWSGSSWSTQTVDSGFSPTYVSFAFDSNDYPAMSYENQNSNSLKYAKWTGTAWSTQTITGNSTTGGYTSLALDANGNPAIAHWDFNGYLGYAKWTGSSWSTQTVDSATGVGSHASLAFDAAGNPAISYYDGTNGDLKYANWTGSAWSLQTVDSNGIVGTHTSLVFDVNGNPSISYYDQSNGDLKYAKWTGAAWSTQTIDSTGNVGQFTSIALDNNGYPMISYIDVTNKKLKFAQWTGFSWSTTVVSASLLADQYTSLALGANGVAHIGFSETTGASGIQYSSATLPGLAAIGGGHDRSRPQAPTNFTAANVYTTSVTWSWTDNASNELGYRLYGSTVSTGTYTLIVGSTTLGANSNSYSETGLTSGTTYYRYVVAVNAGNYATSNMASNLFVASPVPGTITAVSTISVTASWSSVPDAIGYTLTASTMSTNPPTLIAGSTTTYGNAVTVGTVFGLLANTTYYLFVKSNYAVGSSNYATFNATSTWANLPSSIALANVYYTSMTVTWTALPASPSTSTCEGYLLQASTASDFSGVVASSQTSLASVASLTVSTLTMNATYYYRVGSLNQAGAVNYSVSASTKTLSPWTLSTVESIGGIGLYTSLALDANGYPAVGYHDATNSLYKYAKWNGTTWSTQTVDSSGGSVGWSNSLAIGPDGNPAMSYSYWAPGYTLKYAKWNGASWSTQTVDAAATVSKNTSLALDANGNPAISYYADNGQDLKFAQWNGISWSTQTIDSTGDVGLYSSLVFDATGNPAISYYDNTNHDLKYAKWNGTSWSTQTVDSAGDVGQYTALAFDVTGNPAISYYDNTNHDLKYAKWNGASWAIQTIDSVGDVGQYTSLVLDGNGNPSIGYYDVSNGDLKYAQWNGASWNTQIIDSSGDMGKYASLALDGNGKSVISYTDSTNNDLRMATATLSGVAPTIGGGNAKSRPFAPTGFSGVSTTPNSIQWTWTDNDPNALGYRLYGSAVSTGPYTLIVGSTTLLPGSNSYTETGLTGGTTYYRYVTVVNAGNYAFSNSSAACTAPPSPFSVTALDPLAMDRTSLALDANGNPGIAYYDNNNFDLKYAKWNGTSWSTQTIESVGTVGFYPALAFDPSGNPAISYGDNSVGLKYAKWTGSAWSTQTVDNGGGAAVGSDTSLAFDALGNPAISYYDFTNGNLKYAKWTGSAWSTATVDASANDVGRNTSLSFDPNNNPAISYLDNTLNDLKYAKWTGTSWSTQTIESTANTGYYTSMALDANGNPSISYWEGVSDDLRYAKWNGSSWSTQTVESAGFIGRYPSLALDGSGYPMITYTDASNLMVKFAQWTGASWTTTTVSAAGNSGIYSSLALDANGLVHVSYTDTSSGVGLKYASATIAGITGAIGGGNAKSRPQAPTNFAATTISTGSITWTWTDNASNEYGYRLYGSTVSTGPYTLIVGSTTLGANSNSYTETGLTSDTTYYRYLAAVNAGNFAFSNFATTVTLHPWSIRLLDASDNSSAAIALDSSGNPGISYYAGNLSYAHWNGSSWTFQVIDPAPGSLAGYYSSLAYDANGNPAIAYYDYTPHDLKYATWTGSSWSTQTIESAGDVGLNPSLAFDPRGNPAIAYYDTTNGDLKVARWTGSSWSTSTVETNGNVGYYLSLAFDPSGQPSIAYHDSTNATLKLATWTGTAWSTQTVDSSVGAGQFASLAFDANGYPAIAYWHQVNDVVKYVKWNGSAWSTPQAVVSGARFTALALDGNGNPMISCGELTGTLKAKFAQWTGSTWTVVNISTVGMTVACTSLALDANGRVHVAYVDTTGTAGLKYASATLSGISGAMAGGNGLSRPQVPTAFSATSVYKTSVTWSWTDNASNELGYRLYGSTVSTGTYTLIVGTATLGANSNSYTETGLNAGTTYYRFAEAVNAGDFAFSALASTKTLSLGYSVPVGGPSGWLWKAPQSGDIVPSGTPNNWTWRTWTPGSGRKIPTGNANQWSWSSE